MGLTIRAVTFADAHDYALVMCESWKAAYKNIIPHDILERNTNFEKRKIMLEKFMKSETAHYFIAYDGKIPCGICSTGATRDTDASGFGEIVAIYVLPEYWGKGIGKPLMETALGDLRAQGFTKFLLWVFEANNRARRFYEKCGFRADGAKKEFGHGVAFEIRYKLEHH